MRLRVLAIGLSLAVSGALVGTSSAGLLEDRQETMRQTARALRTVERMVKLHKFDAGATAAQGNAIATLLQQLKTLFPAGSEQADQSARAEIWTDRVGFETARVNAYNAALALAKVTEASLLPDAVQHLAGACKACHAKFKIDH